MYSNIRCQIIYIADLYRRKPDKPKQIGSEKLATERANLQSTEAVVVVDLFVMTPPILNLYNRFD